MISWEETVTCADCENFEPCPWDCCDGRKGWCTADMAWTEAVYPMSELGCGDFSPSAGYLEKCRAHEDAALDDKMHARMEEEWDD